MAKQSTNVCVSQCKRQFNYKRDHQKNSARILNGSKACISNKSKHVDDG